MRKKRHSLSAALGIVLTLAAFNAAGAGKEKPADPFDFNFCGGERVYPIIGINISTACGPRNQIALGRRGKLMWLFPGVDAASTHRGTILLDDASLLRLSLLAEVASITKAPTPAEAQVMYKLGINFSARAPKYVHASYSSAYNPANRLVQAMLALVPVSPRLPDCPGYAGIFDPTLHEPARRQAHQAAPRLLGSNVPE